MDRFYLACVFARALVVGYCAVRAYFSARSALNALGLVYVRALVVVKTDSSAFTLFLTPVG